MSTTSTRTILGCVAGRAGGATAAGAGGGGRSSGLGRARARGAVPRRRGGGGGAPGGEPAREMLEPGGVARAQRADPRHVTLRLVGQSRGGPDEGSRLQEDGLLRPE